MFSILIGVVLIAIAAIVLIKPENRTLKWPWAVGIVGVVGFIINLTGFILDRTVDVYDVAERAYVFAARMEESAASLQPTLHVWGIFQGLLLIVVAVVILLKTKNREKVWPWIIGVIGLLMLVSNIIEFLL